MGFFEDTFQGMWLSAKDQQALEKAKEEEEASHLAPGATLENSSALSRLQKEAAAQAETQRALTESLVRWKGRRRALDIFSRTGQT